ncbi:MAG: GNAT family N-acetyltransferase [bacterium]|nr:GNAT family N-acetyltransferase [bacterium]
MIEIRQADESHADTIAGIIRASFRAQAKILGLNPTDHAGFVSFQTAEGIVKRLREDDLFLLACLDGRPVGTMRYGLDADREGFGRMGRLAVLPECRGQRYGADLMRFGEERLMESGAHTVEIAMVARFTRLRAYYESLGYRPTYVREAKELPFDVLFLEKPVGASGETPCTT